MKGHLTEHDKQQWTNKSRTGITNIKTLANRQGWNQQVRHMRCNQGKTGNKLDTNRCRQPPKQNRKQGMTPSHGLNREHPYTNMYLDTNTEHTTLKNIQR